MFKLLTLILSVMWMLNVSASTLRNIDADTITSSDKTKTFTMPAATGTLIVSGAIPIAAQFVRDPYAGDDSTTAFALSFTPAVNAQVAVYLDGILQIITTDYTISGTTLTFVAAPATGQNIAAIYSRY